MGNKSRFKGLPSNLSVASPGKKEVSITRTESAYSGPLPPPAQLEKYEHIKTGFAERIVAMAEAEAVHRRELQTTALGAQVGDVRAERQERRWGQILAAVVTLAATCAGTYTALQEHPVAGTFFGVSGMTGLAAVFIWGKREQATATPTSEPAK